MCIRDRNSLALQNAKESGDLITLVDNYDTDNYVIDHLGDGKFLVFTNYEAPNNKIVMVDINKPSQADWTDFIAEKDYVLKGISRAGDKLVATYMKNVQSKLEVYTLEAEYLYDIELPGIGIASFSSDKEKKIDLTGFAFSYGRNQKDFSNKLKNRIEKQLNKS